MSNSFRSCHLFSKSLFPFLQKMSFFSFSAYQPDRLTPLPRARPFLHGSENGNKFRLPPEAFAAFSFDPDWRCSRICRDRIARRSHFDTTTTQLPQGHRPRDLAERNYSISGAQKTGLCSHPCQQTKLIDTSGYRSFTASDVDLTTSRRTANRERLVKSTNQGCLQPYEYDYDHQQTRRYCVWALRRCQTTNQIPRHPKVAAS